MRTMFFCLLLFVAWRTALCQEVTLENGESTSRIGVGIPLERIWTCGMNGANVSSMDAKHVGEVVSFPNTDAILAALYRNGTVEAPKGFAVQGTEMAALKAARDVFVNGKEPSSELRAEEGVSVVFFTHYCFHHVRIQKVTYDGNTVEIDYYFQKPRASQKYAAFALIPLPNPRPGKINVRIRVDAEMTSADIYRWTKQMKSCVCKPFTFRIL